MNPLHWHEFERQDNLRQERLDRIADQRNGDWTTHLYHVDSSPNCHLCANRLSLSMEAGPEREVRANLPDKPPAASYPFTVEAESPKASTGDSGNHPRPDFGLAASAKPTASDPLKGEKQ